MDDNEPLIVDGERGKRFAVYEADSDWKPIRLVGRYDAVAEVIQATQRLDKIFLIQVGREWLKVPEFQDRFAKG